MIFIIKVTTNKEDRALELISYKKRKKQLNIYSLARPHGLRGYIFLEAEDRDSAEEAAYNLPYVKGIIGKTVTYEEIKNMLEPVMEEINIEKGDIVEIIGELFKKEKDASESSRYSSNNNHSEQAGKNQDNKKNEKEQPLLTQDYEEPTRGLVPDDY